MPSKYFADCGDCDFLQSPYGFGMVFDYIVSVIKKVKDMIKLAIEGYFGDKFECILNSSHTANYMVDKLLKMLSSFHKDEPYSVKDSVKDSIKNIEIETDKKVLGKEYNVCDNSYCINLANWKSAALVQKETMYYSPDEDEKGAKFIICKKPYIEKVDNTMGSGSLYYIFINVVSTNTGNIYRVCYKENCVLA